jgi:hypothetical protein
MATSMRRARLELDDDGSLRHAFLLSDYPNVTAAGHSDQAGQASNCGAGPSDTAVAGQRDWLQTRVGAGVADAIGDAGSQSETQGSR